MRQQGFPARNLDKSIESSMEVLAPDRHQVPYTLRHAGDVRLIITVWWLKGKTAEIRQQELPWRTLVASRLAVDDASNGVCHVPSPVGAAASRPLTRWLHRA